MKYNCSCGNYPKYHKPLKDFSIIIKYFRFSILKLFILEVFIQKNFNWSKFGNNILLKSKRAFIFRGFHQINVYRSKFGSFCFLKIPQKIVLDIGWFQCWKFSRNSTLEESKFTSFLDLKDFFFNWKIKFNFWSFIILMNPLVESFQIFLNSK